jgi:glyoxylase-like metal-dependent hydrolase (beta-lactamase superfamily II)
MLDAGASASHARLFLDALKAENVSAPRYLALTHWHWDHVFGAAEVGASLITHSETANKLATLRSYDWSNTALDSRVATGEEIASCAADIKVELPEPRRVRIAAPEIIFHDWLELHLGNVTCRIQHVGGDHAADSCVMVILPDRVAFLGDCLYDAIYTPVRHYTKKVFSLLDTILNFDANLYIEGHNSSPMTRAELETMADKMRLADQLIEQFGTSEAAILKAAQAQIRQPLDEDTDYFIRAFLAGRTFN